VGENAMPRLRFRRRDTSVPWDGERKAYRPNTPISSGHGGFLKESEHFQEKLLSGVPRIRESSHGQGRSLPGFCLGSSSARGHSSRSRRLCFQWNSVLGQSRTRRAARAVPMFGRVPLAHSAEFALSGSSPAKPCVAVGPARISHWSTIGGCAGRKKACPGGAIVRPARSPHAQ
jgi:hypothetical protein